MAASNSVEDPSQLAFFRLKRLLDVVGCGTITGFTVTHIDAVCAGWDPEPISHIFPKCLKIQDEIRVVSILHC